MSKKIGIIAIILVTVSLLCLVAGVAVWNQLFLEIRLKGEPEQTIEYGESFLDAGAEVLLRGNVIFKEGIVLPSVSVETSGNVDEQTIGRYSIAYEAQFAGLYDNSCRRVTVVDTQSPKILLNDWSVDTLSPGDVFEEPGFSAKDNYDGDITHKVIRSEGAGVITYAVVDSSGNPAYATRSVPEYDPIAPVIQLDGESPFTITVGRQFEEPGYSAYDDVDGDLTHLVTVEGEVDWLHPGEYPLKYTVSDGYLNETSVTRTVVVEAKPWQDTVWPEDKTVYLTFDDGPGPYTMQLLDVLDRYQVKATFFVINTEYADLMQEIVKRGHSIGIHSVTHDYFQIYASPEAYFADLFEMQQIIYENTGVMTSLMRFPGGGSNLVSKKCYDGIMSTLTWAVQNAGFQYFDWNVDSDDAGNAKRQNEVRDNVIKGIMETGVSMVLQHDIHPYSVAAVEDIICWCLDNGYQFQAIRNSTPGFHHDVLN